MDFLVRKEQSTYFCAPIYLILTLLIRSPRSQLLTSWAASNWARLHGLITTFRGLLTKLKHILTEYQALTAISDRQRQHLSCTASMVLSTVVWWWIPYRTHRYIMKIICRPRNSTIPIGIIHSVSVSVPLLYLVFRYPTVPPVIPKYRISFGIPSSGKIALVHRRHIQFSCLFRHRFFNPRRARCSETSVVGRGGGVRRPPLPYSSPRRRSKKRNTAFESSLKIIPKLLRWFFAQVNIEVTWPEVIKGQISRNSIFFGNEPLLRKLL